MELLKTSTASGVTPSSLKGFTLLEILVVVGLFSVLGSLALFVDFNGYRGDAFRAEKAKLVVSLQRARAEALNNVNKVPHGVALFPADHPESFVIFDGASYASSTSRSVIDLSYRVSLASTSPREVVFAQLSADTNASELVLIDPSRLVQTSISINHEGAISY